MSLILNIEFLVLIDTEYLTKCHLAAQSRAFSCKVDVYLITNTQLLVFSNCENNLHIVP